MNNREKYSTFGKIVQTNWEKAAEILEKMVLGGKITFTDYGGWSLPVQIFIEISHFRSKKIVADFLGNFEGKTVNFRKRGGGHANPDEFCCRFYYLPKKRNIVFRNEGGGRGRLEVFRKFIEFGTGSHPLVARQVLRFVKSCMRSHLVGIIYLSGETPKSFLPDNKNHEFDFE